MLERYGFFIIIILLATGILSKIIATPINYLYKTFLIIPTFLLG